MRKLSIIFFSALCSIGVSIFGNPVELHLPPEYRSLIIQRSLSRFRSDVIPDLPSPFKLNDTYFSADSENAKGTLSLVNTIFTGLDNLVDDITVDLASHRVVINLVVPSKLSVKGEYSADGTVSSSDEDISLSAVGNGAFSASVTNLNVAADCKLDINLLKNKFKIDSIDLQLSYDTVKAFAEGLVLNGETVEWESLNNELNEDFETIWNQYNEALSNAVTEGLNELLSDMPFSEVLEYLTGKKSGTTTTTEVPETEPEVESVTTAVTSPTTKKPKTKRPKIEYI